MLISWLLDARDFLCSGFRFYGLHAKVLETIGNLKHLQQLQLLNVQVMGVDFAVQSWPSLWYLSLFQVVVSASDLNSPLLACPKLWSLVLTNPTILSLDARSTLTLTSSSLREFTTVDNVSLEAEVLASLELDRCTLQHFGLVSKGKLRKLTIKRARIPELDIRPETSMLQALHVSNSTIPWPGFGQLISKVPNLKVLQLRGLESRAYSDVMNVDKIVELIPRLNHLAMGLDDQLMRGNVDQLLLWLRTSLLDKLVVLELESITGLNFYSLIEVFLKVCPSLKRFKVYAKTKQALGENGKGNPNWEGFYSSFVKLVRKFPKADIPHEDI